MASATGLSIVFKNRETVRAAFKRFPSIFQEEFINALELAAMILVARTAELAPKGTGEGGGNLYASIAHDQPVAQAGSWRVAYGTPKAHAEAIEYGRKPGSTPPPVMEIARWVWIKRANFDGVETEEDAMSLAFAISKSIGKRGFKSGPKTAANGGTAWGMFEQAKHDKMDEVKAAMQGARRRIARRVMDELAASGSSL